MEQRRPRLGDVLDDYCPRERRITNHAVVAMIEDEIKQTRCVTCDAEHPYKRAKVPPRRKKKDAPGALYTQVLSGMPEPNRPATPGGDAAPALESAAESSAPEGFGDASRPEESAASSLVNDAPAAEPGDTSPPGDGPVRRPLIRATLPRPEGPTVRPIPEFTIRQAPGRDGYRDARSTPNGGRPFSGRGRFDRPGRSNRPGGNRPGQFSQESGHRGGGRQPQARQSRPHPAGRFGKKRSR
jgi:hypothetical protein